MKNLQDLEEFEKKFPFRIYGIAGEPKSEFIITENMPDKIKSFILQDRQEVLEMLAGNLPKERDSNDFDENSKLLSIGFNDCLSEIKQIIKNLNL